MSLGKCCGASIPDTAKRSCRDRRNLPWFNTHCLSGGDGPIVDPIVPATSCQRAQPRESRRLAGSRRRLSRGAWLFVRCCRSSSCFGCGFNRGWQFQLGLFRSAMVAMMQWLDARSFFFHPKLSVASFLALVLKVCWNRFSWHGRSVAEPSPPKLSNFAHLWTIHGPPAANASENHHQMVEGIRTENVREQFTKVVTVYAVVREHGGFQAEIRTAI